MPAGTSGSGRSDNGEETNRRQSLDFERSKDRIKLFSLSSINIGLTTLIVKTNVLLFLNIKCRYICDRSQLLSSLMLGIFVLYHLTNRTRETLLCQGSCRASAGVLFGSGVCQQAKLPGWSRR